MMSPALQGETPINCAKNNPTLPPVFAPVIEWKVLTPAVTEHWNSEVAEKRINPYVYIGLSHQDYLLFTGWLNEVILCLRSQSLLINMK